VVAEQAEASEPVMESPIAEELPAKVQPIAAQEQPVVAEVKPELAAVPISATPIAPTWWTQSAGDEGEAPIAELPEPVRMVSPTARMTPAPGTSGTFTPRTPITRAMRDRLPERSNRELRRREVRSFTPRPAETPITVVSSVNVDPLVEQLEADKFNHTVRLELARAWWSMGNRESALAEYGKLINPAQVEDLSDEELAELEERDFADAGPLAADIIVDLERIVDIDDHPAWPRLLGDQYMKTGDLARALEMYRRALSQL